MRVTRTVIAAGTAALTVVAGSVAVGAPAGAATPPGAPPAATASTSFTPGAAGRGDPYFPLAGNGGYDAQHYDLRLGYDPKSGILSGSAG